MSLEEWLTEAETGDGLPEDQIKKDLDEIDGVVFGDRVTLTDNNGGVVVNGKLSSDFIKKGSVFIICSGGSLHYPEVKRICLMKDDSVWIRTKNHVCRIQVFRKKS